MSKSGDWFIREQEAAAFAGPPYVQDEPDGFEEPEPGPTYPHDAVDVCVRLVALWHANPCGGPLADLVTEAEAVLAALPF
jgi:hypothetical protein